MCHVEWDERAAVWDETTPRARKAHTCDLCRLAILPGTVHTRIGIYIGGWSSVRMHSDCWALSTYIQRHICEQETIYVDGDLRGEVREHMQESPEVLRMWRDVLRVRRAEGVWPVRRAA